MLPRTAKTVKTVMEGYPPQTQPPVSVILKYTLTHAHLCCYSGINIPTAQDICYIWLSGRSIFCAISGRKKQPKDKAFGQDIPGTSGTQTSGYPGQKLYASGFLLLF